MVVEVSADDVDGVEVGEEGEPGQVGCEGVGAGLQLGRSVDQLEGGEGGTLGHHQLELGLGEGRVSLQPLQPEVRRVSPLASLQTGESRWEAVTAGEIRQTVKVTQQSGVAVGGDVRHLTKMQLLQLSQLGEEIRGLVTELGRSDPEDSEVRREDGDVLDDLSVNV